MHPGQPVSDSQAHSEISSSAPSSRVQNSGQAWQAAEAMVSETLSTATCREENVPQCAPARIASVAQGTAIFVSYIIEAHFIQKSLVIRPQYVNG